MRFKGLLAGLLFCATASFGASPQLLNLVMPDADTVAGVNVSTAKLSPLGQFLLTKLQSGDAGIQQLAAMTGFNPLTDVSEILLATANPSQKTGFVAALGTFSPDQIAGALAKDQNVTQSTYAGATLFTFTPPKATASSSIAFIATTVAIMGDTASVKAALDRNSGTNVLPSALAAPINALGANDDAWLVSNASLSSLIPATASTAPGGPGMAMQFLKSVTAFNAGVKLGENTVTSVNLTADNAQDATALSNVAQMLISLGAANSGNNQSNPQLTAVLGLLKNATVAADGTNVAITLTMPEAQLEALLNGHAGGN